MKRFAIGAVLAIAAFFALGMIHRATTAPEQLAIDDCMRQVRAATDPQARSWLLQRCDAMRQAWREKLLADTGANP